MSLFLAAELGPCAHTGPLSASLSAITLKFFLGHNSSTSPLVYNKVLRGPGKRFLSTCCLARTPFSHTELPFWQHTEILSACPLSCTLPQMSQCPRNRGTWSSEPLLCTRNPLASASASPNRKQDETGKDSLKCGAAGTEISILRSSTRTDTTPPL